VSPQELKARARRVIEELFNQGDLAVADELFTADLVHNVPGPPPAAGVEGTKRWVTNLRRAFPDHHGTIEDEIAEGDKVVQRITCSGTHEGTFLDVAPTGRHVTYEVMEIMRVGPDGKFAEHWSSVDVLAILRQVGAVPAPEGSLAS
jgi:predicted ester cyclase